MEGMLLPVRRAKVAAGAPSLSLESETVKLPTPVEVPRSSVTDSNGRGLLEVVKEFATTLPFENIIGIGKPPGPGIMIMVLLADKAAAPEEALLVLLKTIVEAEAAADIRIEKAAAKAGGVIWMARVSRARDLTKKLKTTARGGTDVWPLHSATRTWRKAQMLPRLMAMASRPSRSKCSKAPPAPLAMIMPPSAALTPEERSREQETRLM